MKLQFKTFDFDKFTAEMQNLKQKGFDYLVTIVGEDFSKTPDYQPGEPALGCIYIFLSSVFSGPQSRDVETQSALLLCPYTK